MLCVYRKVCYIGTISSIYNREAFTPTPEPGIPPVLS